MKHLSDYKDLSIESQSDLTYDSLLPRAGIGETSIRDPWDFPPHLERNRIIGSISERPFIVRVPPDQETREMVLDSAVGRSFIVRVPPDQETREMVLDSAVGRSFIAWVPPDQETRENVVSVKGLFFFEGTSAVQMLQAHRTYPLVPRVFGGTAVSASSLFGDIERWRASPKKKLATFLAEEELPLDHTIPPPLRDIGKARVKTIKGHKVKPDPVELDRFA